MSGAMRGLRHFYCAVAALVCGLASAIAIPAHGAALDQQDCEQLQLRLDALRKDGVEADMALGPEAARTTLPIERFNRIGAYIEAEEQLNFRCGFAKQRIVLPTTVEGGEEELPGPGEVKVEGTSKTIALPLRAPADRRRPPAAATSASIPLPEVKPARKTQRPAPAQGAAKKKPAGKVDDAYRPPSKSGSGG